MVNFDVVVVEGAATAPREQGMWVFPHGPNPRAHRALLHRKYLSPLEPLYQRKKVKLQRS